MLYQHIPFCNYHTGPVGGPGCICALINKNDIINKSWKQIVPGFWTPPILDEGTLKYVSEKWAIFFTGYPESVEDIPGFMENWTLYDTEDRARRECDNSNVSYRSRSSSTKGHLPYVARKVYIYSTEYMPSPEQQSPYGYCPHCSSKGLKRERRPDGNDTCENGHVYPSTAAVFRK